MALGRTPLPTAYDRLLAQVTSGGRHPPTIVATVMLDPMARRLSPRQHPDGKRCAAICLISLNVRNRGQPLDPLRLGGGDRIVVK
jgi:hypothetical protein